MLASVARIAGQIRASKAFIGPDLKLVVLPEYVLTGFPLGDPIPAWRDKAAISLDDGAVLDALRDAAQAAGVFLAGNAYDTDPAFPHLYFQSCFVLSPSGERVLRYRRLISMYAPTPHDVWTAYLDTYGLDAVFPVADTEIGRLACIASEEILYPEIARAHALRGAEVFLHSSAEPQGFHGLPKNVAKRARALENLAYVVSANTGAVFGTPVPPASTDGGSQVVDYRGLVIAETGPGESMAAYAEIDLGALKRWRRRPGMPNLLARQRLELFQAAYAGSVYPADTIGDAAPDRSHFRVTLQSAIDRLDADGTI